MFNRYYEKTLYPSSWKQVSLIVFSDIYTGNSLSDTDKKKYSVKEADSLIYVSTKDVSMSGTLNYDTNIYIPKRLLDSFKVAQANSILICLEGANAGNKLSVTEREICFVNKLCAVKTIEINSRYLFYFFRSELFRKQFFENIQGIIGGIPLSNFKELDILIPPIEEQNRIVSKLNSLFLLLDKIDTLTEEQTGLSISIKEKILSLAIQGKLVPQDESDEPASVLLDKIRAEKRDVLGKKYVDSYIYRGDDNCYYEHKDGKNIDITTKIPYELPKYWQWERWGNISLSIQYGYNAPAKTRGRIKMVRISDIQDNAVLWDSVPYCDISEDEIGSYLLKANDILFARTGGTVGKSYIVTEVPDDAIYAGYLIRSRYGKYLLPQYIKYFMESNLYWMQLKEGTTATAQPNCNGKTLGQMLLPIPPLEEQKRIVAKIDELFSML